ncbi:MAG: alpha/beta hydrolase-fold protein [Metallosphaera sp.]|uniref:alpha/beta hydrolase-fold protein n=1 Tax=Metallosphaera sp. TaxID=2020860 RepID=UPI0031786570
MEVFSLEIESSYLRDNPWKDPYRRKVVVLKAGEVDQAPGLLYLSGYFSTSLAQLNVDPISENMKERIERLVRNGSIRGVYLILPDTFTIFGGNQYLDSKIAGLYESFIMRELIPEMRDRFQISDFAVMGKSSGGYGALQLGSKYDFKGLAVHSPDVYFEYAYLPLFPKVIQTLRRVGNPRQYVEFYWSQQDRKKRDLMDALMIVGLSAFYSPGEDLMLPFDLETGKIDDEVWNHWLSLDPVRFLPERKDKLRGKHIYIDVGTKDEFHLQYGTRMVHKMLSSWDIQHLYEEFQGGHMNTSFRYDISLAYIINSINRNGQI